MSRNQLPEGVGKKIVEALKRQAEADITPLDDINSSADNTVPLSDIEHSEEIQFNSLLNETENDNVIIEEEVPALNMNPQLKEETAEIKNTSAAAVNNTIQAEQVVNNDFREVNTLNIQNNTTASNFQVRIPANVAVLKKLILSLPAGVSKQTGAQIIRQTLEAMGLPMASVLKEAQEVQEELNISARESMIKIQEYRTNILQLEQTVQQYKQNINQINDLVSLFLLTDKK